jgi:hypothetical protein
VEVVARPDPAKLLEVFPGEVPAIALLRPRELLACQQAVDNRAKQLEEALLAP